MKQRRKPKVEVPVPGLWIVDREQYLAVCGLFEAI